MCSAHTSVYRVRTTAVTKCVSKSSISYIYTADETCSYSKRDLPIWLKRPTNVMLRALDQLRSASVNRSPLPYTHACFAVSIGAACSENDSYLF